MRRLGKKMNFSIASDVDTIVDAQRLLKDAQKRAASTFRLTVMLRFEISNEALGLLSDLNDDDALGVLDSSAALALRLICAISDPASGIYSGGGRNESLSTVRQMVDQGMAFTASLELIHPSSTLFSHADATDVHAQHVLEDGMSHVMPPSDVMSDVMAHAQHVLEDGMSHVMPPSDVIPPQDVMPPLVKSPGLIVSLLHTVSPHLTKPQVEGILKGCRGDLFKALLKCTSGSDAQGQGARAVREEEPKRQRKREATEEAATGINERGWVTFEMSLPMTEAEFNLDQRMRLRGALVEAAGTYSVTCYVKECSVFRDVLRYCFFKSMCPICP
jgi:hypothetical protein